MTMEKPPYLDSRVQVVSQHASNTKDLAPRLARWPGGDVAPDGSLLHSNYVLPS